MAGSGRLRLAVSIDAADVIRHLPSEIKQGVKAALRILTSTPEEGAPLHKELEGVWRYRVRRFRIAYAIARRAGVLRVVAAGHRRTVYEALAARLRRPPAG